MKIQTIYRLLLALALITACTPISTDDRPDVKPNDILNATISAQGTSIANLEIKMNDQSTEPTIEVLETTISYLATAVGGQRALVQRTAAVPTPWLPTPTINTLPKVYPLEARTTLEEVNKIIDVFLSDEIGSRAATIRYTTAACTNADGLGGPPKCEDGVDEGTMVEVFPLSGPEGHYTNRQGIEKVLDIGVTGVYAVYRVPADAYQAEYWPAGQYGIVFILEETIPIIAVSLIVEDGQVVRLDYIFGDGLAETIAYRSGDYVLPPLSE